MRIPALDSATAYTTVPLSRVLQEYYAWRSHMLPMSVGDKALVRKPEAARVSQHLYISGRPDDETVADLYFRAADRSFLVTSTGSRVLDWSTCLNAPLGHSERIDTSELPVNSGNYHTHQRDALVQRLADVFPFLGGVQFRSSGTEAVEAGIRFIEAAVGTRPHVVAIEGCYHGLTLGARHLMGTAQLTASPDRAGSGVM